MGMFKTVRAVLPAAIFGLFITGLGASPSDSLFSDYHRGLNTDFWLWTLNYHRIFGQHTSIQVSDMVSSSRLILSGTDDKWKDSHQFRLDLRRDLTSFLALTMGGTSHYFSDKQTGYYDSDVLTNGFSAGIVYNYNDQCRIPAHVGLKSDKRFGQEDQGLSYGAGFYCPRTEWADYHHVLQSHWETDDLGRRRNTTMGLSYQITRQFYAQTTDTFRVHLDRQRRDYYISASGDIESRIEKGSLIENRLTYQLGDNFYCHLAGALSTRNLRIKAITDTSTSMRRNRVDDNIYGSLRLLWQNSVWQSRLAFSYQGENQSYQFAGQAGSSPFSGGQWSVVPDTRSLYTNLLYYLGWRRSGGDSLFCFTRIQRFRYDTPDPENYDDRDELRYWVNLGSTFRLTESLTGRCDLSLHFIHLVYIMGQRSADNNWTRIMRLSPSISWQPHPRFRWTQSAEILANYVAYDYEEILPGIRSYLYRKLRIEDSTMVDITRKTSLRLYYRLELDENGKLVWDQWLEQKLTDRHSHTFTFVLDFEPWSGFHITPGYSYFHRIGQRYIPQLTGDGTPAAERMIDFQNYGPMISVRCRLANVRLEMSGSTVITRIPDREKQRLSRVNIDMSWFL